VPVIVGVAMFLLLKLGSGVSGVTPSVEIGVDVVVCKSAMKSKICLYSLTRLS